MEKNLIPYVIGITGHKDIQKDCLPFVEKELHRIFSEIKKELPNTPIFLMSPLAEGADSLAADVALQNEIKLIVPMPMEKSEYLKDFNTGCSLPTFESLLSQSEQHYFVGYAEDNSVKKIVNRAAQYEKVGQHIADTCNFLIAIWDQKEIEKVGGTSHIVNYKRKGTRQNIFDGLDGNAIQIIPTHREGSQEKNSHNLDQLPPEILGQKINTKPSYEAMLSEIDEANKVLLKSTKKTDTNNPFFLQLSERFSGMADTYQSAYKSSSIILVIISWFVILFLEILHNFGILWLMVPYAIFVSGAFAYYWVKVKKTMNKELFIFFRGISEALRVQYYWEHAGIQDSVADFYFRKNYSSITWMKIALKNLYTLNRYVLKNKQDDDIEAVKKLWIDEQLDYYRNAISSRKAKYKKLERREHLFYKIGWVFSGITFVVFLLKFFHLNVGIGYEQLSSLFHYTLFISGMSLVSAAFIGEKYLFQAGYKEDVNNFEIMEEIFTAAKNLLEQEERNSLLILRELGKEVLNENSHWVALHYDRKLKVSIG